MRIEILNGSEVLQTIIADEEFAEQHYPGAWRIAEYQDEPAAPTPATPDTCSPAQGIVALYALKDITESDILTAIALIPDPVERYTAQVGYSRSTEWRKDSPTMGALAALLGLTPDDLDALFTYAVGVTV